MYEPEEVALGILEEFADRTGGGARDPRLEGLRNLYYGFHVEFDREVRDKPSGRSRANKKWTDEERAEFRMCASFLSQRALASRFGIDRKTVRHHLKKLRNGTT